MNTMTQPAPTGPRTRTRRLPVAVRATIATITLIGGAVAAFSSGVMAMLQYGGGLLSTTPWDPWLAIYTLGALAGLIIPILVWWYLLPRARWWGVAVMALVTTLYILIIMIA
jgi:hypothetical protein